MNSKSTSDSPASWAAIVSKYNKPTMAKSIWQLVNSIVPYILLWFLIIEAMKISIWLALPLIVLAAGFLVRIFIIFHDCGHKSFFRSKKLNIIVGKACGILTFTPFHKWTDSHRNHHNTVGNLDKRGDGDVWTMTVEEYLNASKRKQFFYRLFRNPIILILLAGPLNFLVYSRFTRKTMTKKQKKNIYFTNIILLIIAVGMSLLIGWKLYLFIQLLTMGIAGMMGIFLFYFQHQYEDVIWRRNKDWNFKDMALKGSSYFKLPALLRWFTGNIGYHHVHHLGPSIPNYNLRQCYNENAMFQKVKPITFFNSLHALKLRLWDEKNQQIISFKQLQTGAM